VATDGKPLGFVAKKNAAMQGVANPRGDFVNRGKSFPTREFQEKKSPRVPGCPAESNSKLQYWGYAEGGQLQLGGALRKELGRLELHRFSTIPKSHRKKLESWGVHSTIYDENPANERQCKDVKKEVIV